MKSSQTTRLYQHLKSIRRRVSMISCAQAMSNNGSGTGICVSRRIFDLRKMGCTIKHTWERIGKRRFSFYRLVRGKK